MCDGFLCSKCNKYVTVSETKDLEYEEFLADVVTFSCCSWSMAKQGSWISKDFAITSISFEVKAGFVLLEICF